MQFDDLTKCKVNVINTLKNGSLFPNENYFHRNTADKLEADPNGTITLTLLGCQALCGSGWGWFHPDDVFKRLDTWLVPILLLLGNIQLPPLGLMYRGWTIFHVIGDPIDSICVEDRKILHGHNFFFAIDRE